MIMIQPWLFVSQGWVSSVSRVSRIRTESETCNPTPDILIFLILKHQNSSHPERAFLLFNETRLTCEDFRRCDCLHELNMISLILTRLRFFSGPVSVLVLMTKYRFTPGAKWGVTCHQMSRDVTSQPNQRPPPPDPANQVHSISIKEDWERERVPLKEFENDVIPSKWAILIFIICRITLTPLLTEFN